MTTITIDRAVVEQALEALEDAARCVQENYLPDQCGHDWDEQITALRAALAQKHDPVAHSGWVLREVLFDNGEPIGHREPQHSPAALAQEQAEPVQEPVTLKRGLTGRCTRKVCECEKEGFGLECIHLEPMIDGYPLWSGIPKAEPVQEPVAIADGTFNHDCPIGTLLYTVPPKAEPLTEEEIMRAFYGHRLSVVEIARAIERAHGIGEQDGR